MYLLAGPTRSAAGLGQLVIVLFAGTVLVMIWMSVNDWPFGGASTANGFEY